MATNRSGNRCAPGRIMLFSYGGKAVKKKDPGAPAEKKRDERGSPPNIIDYDTLLSWYNEHSKEKAVGYVRENAPVYIRKQKDLKFIML